MAQEAVDLIAHKAGNSQPCRTHEVPLPGGEAAAPSAETLGREHTVPSYAAARISYRHGAEAERILSLAEERPELRAFACSCEGVTFAELLFSLREEFASSLTDLRRRCRLGMGVCQGARCGGPAAALLAGELGLSHEKALAEANAFLDERWKGHRPVLAGDGLAQAELFQCTYYATCALPRDGAPERPWR